MTVKFGKNVEGSSCILRYFTRICLEELGEQYEKLSHDSQSSGWDLNTGPPMYEAEVLTPQLQYLVYC
jgi:hypothetical protein